jgi:salicylate hydroxylase
MSVIVVGGGVGGLSLALALARRGLTSTVLEQASAIEPVGAGLQLGPNAVRILEGWGLGAGLAEASIEPLRAEVRDAASGALLVANRLGEDARARWGAAYRVMTRSALQGLLLEAAVATGLVDLRLGSAVVRIRRERDGVAAVLEGRDEIEGDVLFGCDGLHSIVRDDLLGRRPPRFTGQTVWRGLAEMSDGPRPQVQVWTSSRKHFVRYPVAEGLVNMVAVVEAGEAETESWTQDGQGSDLAAAFDDWPERVRATIAAVARPWRSALYDRPPLHPWSRGRATLLGDAVHPMLPFLAQGAAMAIEDAEVAARCLSGGAHPEAALRAYKQQRWARATKVQAWSRRNATLFHLPSPVARAVFGAADAIDRLKGADGEARFDWLYGWTP